MSDANSITADGAKMRRKTVCRKCAGSAQLLEAVATRNEDVQCSYCGRPFNSAARVGGVADAALGRLHALIDLGKGPPRAKSDRRTVRDVVEANLVRAHPDFVADTLALITNPSTPNAFNADDAHFWTFQREDLAGQEDEWQRFRETLRSGSRFFNPGVRAFLDDLFAPLPRMTAGGLIVERKPIAELAASRELFRARRANSAAELTRIASAVAEQLHAPPPNLAPANRMNVERMPAFYASFDEKTAIAETRPSIGSDVVVGRFRTTRPLKVLDFTILSRAGGVTFSIWDRRFNRLTVLRSLLRRLQARISKPVRPGEEHEYLETQVVADYLFTQMALDGVMFESAQNEGGINVVIFNGALGPYAEIGGFKGAPLAFVEGSAGLYPVCKVEIIAPLKRKL